MKVEALEIPDVKLITPKRHGDARGYFSEVYNARSFKEAGVTCDFVQDNESLSAQKGTLRGLHFQAPPFAQAKLVRVLAGTVVDVAVDARKSSPTFGQWVKAKLSAENGVQIFVPAGFLHGFLTLEANTHVAYKVDNFYDKASDSTVKWDDPDLNIDWGMDAGGVQISEKDAAAQGWRDFDTPF